ncbi:MAG: hypothetical protein ACFFDT_22650 [Candidatus Hodarchaeota archaeon]
MPGIAHLGIGLASKRIAPKVPLWILLISTYLIDIIFIGFFIFRIEQFPEANQDVKAIWSHSLSMAMIWSVLAAIGFGFIYNNIIKENYDKVIKTEIPNNTNWKSDRYHMCVLIGLLTFSHWVLDFIAQPMTAVFPNETGLALHPLGGSPELGVGVMSTDMGVWIIEGGILILGILIYTLSLFQNKKKMKLFSKNKVLSQLSEI